MLCNHRHYFQNSFITPRRMVTTFEHILMLDTEVLQTEVLAARTFIQSLKFKISLTSWIPSSLSNPLQKATLQSQPASDPVSPLPLPPLAQATATCLWSPCLSPRCPHPSAPTLSTAPTAILLRCESVHSTSLLGALQQEAHLSEPGCSGRTLMPRPPLRPFPSSAVRQLPSLLLFKHATPALTSGPLHLRSPPSGTLCHQPIISSGLCSNVTYPQHSL